MVKRYGDRMARSVQNRMGVLRHAKTLSMVPTRPPERRHLLTVDRKGQYAVDLVHPYRLIFEPSHDPIPLHDDGSIDTDQVTAITIVEVTDYH